MASTKWYTAVYVALFVLATAQVAVEFTGLLDEIYWTAFAIIGVLSFAKAVMVASEYQHLRHEPRSITYVILSALIAALSLTVAAAYSIL